MELLPFKRSNALSIGVELEYQIIDPYSYGLVSRAKELIKIIKRGPYKLRIKPEITQSMIEINSAIHYDPNTLLKDLLDLQEFMLAQTSNVNVSFCGGGTHPFQKWIKQKIFPIARYKRLAKKFRYLSKRATVFGQHIHIGCENAEDALYLTHALARYVPQFIAISASSPFYQGFDTGYCSARSTIFNSFPLSGIIPYISNWHEFSNYFYKMKNFDIITTMKDFYWDIRPKPEFGTVEIRVLDTPLTIKKAVAFAAYVQALSFYLLQEKSSFLIPDLYYLYSYNRFQASRYGFDGKFINPYTSEQKLIREDLIETIKKIEKYIDKLGSANYIADLFTDVVNKSNDANLLKQIFKQVHSLPKVVAEQCNAWKNNNF